MFATPLSQAFNKITTVPAPIGGLNARDSLAAMPATDAYVLNNYWPQPYGLAVRNGYREWAILPTTAGIHTLAQWSSISGAKKLFAWQAGSLWDATTSGVLTTPLLTGLANDFWQFTSMSNAAGSHLIAVNGADDGILYDEGGLQALVAGDGVVVNTWNGLDPADTIQLTIHQSRLWAVKKDSSIGYYLPQDAIYGTFEQFDFGPKFPNGGYLAFLATWTIDDGNGAEDHIVAVSSTGTAVVYGGIDVSDSATWQLVGVYNIGAPVLGRRSYTKVGGDLYILTTQGIVSMSGMLTSTKVNDQKSSFPSDKIQFLLSNVISSYGDIAGWQLSYFPDLNMLLCNVPTTVATGNFQLAANQIIFAWTQFTNMDAACWGTFSSKPFFGTYDGRICKAWDGTLDDVRLDNTGGSSITAAAAQAYSYFESLGTQKQIGMYRPNFISNSGLIYNSTLTYDFKDASIAPPDGLPIVPPNGVWDVDYWDQTTWAGAQVALRSWVQGQGLGVAASIALISRTNGEALWVSTDYSYIVGTIL